MGMKGLTNLRVGVGSEGGQLELLFTPVLLCTFFSLKLN